MSRLLFISLLFSSLFFIGCEDDVHTEEMGQWPTSEWDTNSPDAVGLNPEVYRQLEADILTGDYSNIHSFLVVRDRYLVFEVYKKSNPDHVHTVQSVTKSVASVLTGIAMEQGYVREEEHVLDIFTDYDIQNVDELKQQMTVHHLLTMKSGFEWHEWGYALEETDTAYILDHDDWVQYVLDKPMEAVPGTMFKYNSGNSVLLSGIIDERISMKTQEFALNYLFLPIGMQDAAWPIQDAMGHVHTGGGLCLTARDMARFGLLILNDGNWDGEQIVSKSYLDKSLIIDSANVMTVGRGQGKDPVHFNYGYMWWILTVELEDGTTLNIYAALGHGGQMIFILKPYNMVVTTTAWITDSYPAIDILLDVVIPSIVEG
jgi:CubicO group peptidase (beta-lactamase class C family)